VRARTGRAASAAALTLGMLTLGLAAPALAAPPSSSPPPPPPSLAGESFLGTEPGTAATSCTVNTDKSGSAGFTATGTAAGPYPGTFTESGTYSFGPSVTYGTVTAFHSTFTITSATGAVSGTKDLAAVVPDSSLGYCANGAPTPGPFSIAYLISTPVTYQATITTPAGPYSDSGSATVSSAVFNFGLLGPQAFQEQFLTSNGVVAPFPQTKEDCKNSGYATYGYKNQGQCVSDVNHGS
jgi:hypothetical protein